MRQRTVLVVDDEPDIRDSMTAFVQAHWPLARVLEAPSADAAEGMLEKEPAVDVVVSDLKMPGEDGLTFLRRLGKRLPRARRILMTAHYGPEVEDDARVVGARVLRKPFDLGELQGTLAAAIDG